MSNFNPDKLSVEFRDCVSSSEPIFLRRYTLTHSDRTADLYLTIGRSFALDKIGPMRDEVLGEWATMNGCCVFNVYVEVGGPYKEEIVAKRASVFQRELPLALIAMRYGDRHFFSAYPQVDRCPILVHFRSTYPQYHRIENWGTFSNYKV